MLANRLTMLRIALTPAIMWFLFQRGERYLQFALLLLAVAAITDALDGWAARHFDQESEFGAKLDPAADKVLAAGIFLSFWMLKMIPGWLAWVVFGRDLAILGGAWMLNRRIAAKKFPPRTFGKQYTLYQLMLASIVMIHAAFGIPWIVYLEDLTIDIVVILAVMSLLDYAYWARRQITASNLRMHEARSEVSL